MALFNLRIKTRILECDSEVQTFAKRFAKRGNPVSLEYLRQSQVRAFFDSSGKMFAGFALNQTKPLRYVEWIPESSRGQVPLINESSSLSELTCIWIYGREGRMSSELVYFYTLIDALRSGTAFTLGGTLSKIVYGIQSQALPRLLYEGTTEYFGTPRHCWIYGADRRQLFLSIAVRIPRSVFNSLTGRANYLGIARQRVRSSKS